MRRRKARVLGENSPEENLSFLQLMGAAFITDVGLR
jgi:hypothetical protein